MDIKNEKCIILGSSGSGKDFLLRELTKIGLKPCLKSTTRPMRKFEKQGESYDFLDLDKFKKMIENDEFLVYQKFIVEPKYSPKEEWYYGITKKEFESSQVFIMTPGEFLNINEEDRKSLFVVFLDIERNIRESRLFNRNDNNDSIKRRLDSDDEDFKDLDYYDLKITDPDFNANDVYDLMF